MSWKQVVLTGFGGPEKLELRQVEDLPQPGPGRVRVRVLATSAAFTDTIIRRGLYPDVKDKPPFVPGYDMVGVVDAVGQAVTRVKPGQIVADMTVIGAYATYIVRHEASLTPVPDGLDPVQALGAVLSGVTPWQMLHRIAGVQPGQGVVIQGAGGAVGTAMVQLARAAGITAYGIDRPEKHDLIAGLGGVPLDRDPDGMVDRVLEASGGGVDAVFDPLGGDSFARSFRMLRPGGVLVGFGFQDAMTGAGGSVPLAFLKLKLWNWLPNGKRTDFYSIGALRKRHPDWFRADLAAVLDLMAQGRLKPVVAEVLPLERAREAHERIDAGGVRGKLVLQVSDLSE